MVIFSGGTGAREDMLARLPWLPEPFRCRPNYFTGRPLVVYEIPETNAENRNWFRLLPRCSKAESSPNVG